MTTAALIARPFPPGSWFAGLRSLPLACMDCGGVPTDAEGGVRYTFADGSALFLDFNGGWSLVEVTP